MPRKTGSRSFRREKIGSLLVFLGCFLLLLGLTSSCQHYYTSAAPGAEVEYWLQHQWIDGDPVVGQPGCLFEGMMLTVESNGETVFSGPMKSFDTIEVTDIVSSLGEETTIQMNFHLPGEGRNNNIYQGAWVRTQFKLITRCTDASGDVQDCPIKVDSTAKHLAVYNMMPGDSYSATMRFVAEYSRQGESRAPVIGDQRYSWWIFLAASVLIFSGLWLKRSSGNAQKANESTEVQG